MTLTSSSRPALPLKLTPLQTSETVTWVQGAPIEPRNLLQITPGLPAELAVQIENKTKTAIAWRLEVKGEFPRSWCLQEVHSGSIAANAQLHRQFPFAIPLDWFEQAETIDKLDYAIEIFLYAETQLVGYEAYRLTVQPACTYLDFLPDIYRTSDFLGRFLTLFEQAFDPTVQAIGSCSRLVD